MCWTSKLLALAVTGALGTHALDASILNLPSGSRDGGSHMTISEEAARAILELRLESSVASILGSVEADTVDRLNQFSGAQSTLFGGSSDLNTPQNSLIVLEGLSNNIGSTIRNAQPHSLYVPNSSHDLVDSLTESITSSGKGKSCAYKREGIDKETDGFQSLTKCLSNDPVLSKEVGSLDSAFLAQVYLAEVWVSHDQMNSVSKLSFEPTFENANDITSTLHRLAQPSTTHYRDATAVILTPGHNDMPASESYSRRSARSLGYASSSHQSRRSTQGLPLHSNLAPVCHASNSSCAEATNNCSGHGYCDLKYGSGTKASSSDCYTCRCQQTITRNSDGTIQKTQWGGPSCEKKDISSPFFLIAGVSVFAILLISSAIGLLFNMGQQELPGIISAGVAGSKPPA